MAWVQGVTASGGVGARSAEIWCQKHLAAACDYPDCPQASVRRQLEIRPLAATPAPSLPSPLTPSHTPFPSLSVSGSPSPSSSPFPSEFSPRAAPAACCLLHQHAGEARTLNNSHFARPAQNGGATSNVVHAQTRGAGHELGRLGPPRPRSLRAGGGGGHAVALEVSVGEGLAREEALLGLEVQPGKPLELLLPRRQCLALSFGFRPSGLGFRSEAQFAGVPLAAGPA